MDIAFNKGDPVTLPDTPAVGEAFKNYFTNREFESINVFRFTEPVCYVCRKRINGSDTFDLRELDDHSAFVARPKMGERRNGMVNIEDIEVEKNLPTEPVIEATIGVTKPYGQNISHIKIDDATYKFFVPRDFKGMCVGKCEVKLFLVKYETNHEDVKVTKRRIVVVPIFDLSDTIETFNNFVQVLKYFQVALFVFGFLFTVYLIIALQQRLYACFQYFILGSVNRVYAEKAWDTLYFFRYPLDSRARAQAVYQSLYLHED